jgi:hypothetical protein
VKDGIFYGIKYVWKSERIFFGLGEKKEDEL